MSGFSVVQRHPTIPMTKRDSLSTNASRLSLISDNSSASNSRHLNDKDHSGHKRRRKAQRSESYKRATQGLSVFEDVCAENGPREIKLTSKTKEDRRKYNTLPIGKENNNNVVNENTSHHKTQKEKHSQFVDRNSSVKSGTYPSPDTDDSPYSVEPERKKKSGFKRFKERLVLTFRKDARERKRRLEKENKAGKSGQKTGHKNDKHGAVDNKPQKNGIHIDHRHSHGIHETNVIQDSPVKIRKELSIFQQFRESFRRKSPPEYRKERSKCYSKGNANDAHNSTSLHSSTTSGSKGSNGQRQPVINHTNSSIERSGDKTNKSYNSHYGEIDESSKHHTNNKGQSSQMRGRFVVAEMNKDDANRHDDDEEEAEDYLEESDLTTDIFGAIIDPSSRPDLIRQLSSLRERSPRQAYIRAPAVPATCLVRRTKAHGGADRSNLKLEGLRKYRPKSVDKTPVEGAHSISYSRQSSHTHRGRTAVVEEVHYGRFHVYGDLSPEVETDGPDYADGVATDDEELTGLSDAFIDADDHKAAVNNVARCLKIVADRIVEEKRRTVTEDEIVKALREIADEIDREKFQGKSVPFGIPRELIPAMTSIIKAKTYASFVDVIKQETAKTIGWEQVAWYTLLTKSALQITGLGQEAGKRVKSMAMKYFNKAIRPFVDSRPKGWESIHEDTDIDTDLD